MERIKDRALMEEPGYIRMIPGTNGSSVTGLPKITSRLIKNSNRKGTSTFVETALLHIAEKEERHTLYIEDRIAPEITACELEIAFWQSLFYANQQKGRERIETIAIAADFLSF